MLRLFLFAAHLFCSCNARTFDTFAGDLFYGSLAATHTEWRTSFSHEPPGATGLAHVWLRCRSAVLRAFFTLESADNTTPTEGARWMTTNHLQFGDEDNKNAAFFLVVAGRKPHVHWHGYSGGFFVQNVTVGKGDAPGAVAVGVHGWARSFEFPLRRCNAPDPAVWGRRRGHLHYWNTSSLTKAPDGGGLVMGVTTWAHVDAAFVAAVARHAAYHRCLLALDKYFFITSESNFASLLLHPEIEALVEQGYLRLISAPAQPGATANAPVAWQGVIENLLLLVLWGGLWKHVLLWDPDEFAVVESPAALTSLLANATAASFKRVDAARVLAVGKAGEQSLPDVGCRFDSPPAPSASAAAAARKLTHKLCFRAGSIPAGCGCTRAEWSPTKYP